MLQPIQLQKRKHLRAVGGTRQWGGDNKALSAAAAAVFCERKTKLK